MSAPSSPRSPLGPSRLARALLAALAFASSITASSATVDARPASRPRLAAVGPLPSLPSIARARLEIGTDHVVVIEDVLLPRGTWQGGDFDLYVAFGAPGAPLAFDARILPVPDGALAPDEAEKGEVLAIDKATHRPWNAHPLLGSPRMTGAVVHVRDPLFKKATAPGGMAALRIRSLIGLPPEDARTGREVLVRLGTPLDTPITLGRIQVAPEAEGTRSVSRAEAHLCGPEADPWPLAVTVVPRDGQPPAARTTVTPAPIAPVLAVRHGTDDLCIRFWE